MVGRAYIFLSLSLSVVMGMGLQEESVEEEDKQEGEVNEKGNKLRKRMDQKKEMGEEWSTEHGIDGKRQAREGEHLLMSTFTGQKEKASHKIKTPIPGSTNISV